MSKGSATADVSPLKLPNNFEIRADDFSRNFLLVFSGIIMPIKKCPVAISFFVYSSLNCFIVITKNLDLIKDISKTLDNES